MPTCKSPLKGPSFLGISWHWGHWGSVRKHISIYFNKIKFQLFKFNPGPGASPDYLSKRQSQEGYLTGPSFKRPQLRTCSPANHKSHRCRMEAILGELPLGLGHRLNNPPFCASSSWLHTSGEGQSCLLPFTVQDGTPFSSGKPTLSRIQMSHTHKLVSPTPSLLGGEMCRFKSIDFEICYNQSESSNLSCVFICHW